VHLLVVEDDISIAEPLCEGLTREGFDVRHATTGREALDALASAPADLVLLDLGLPDLDGRVVCREIRDSSQIPIIVVTARSDEIDRVSLLELGADDYVVKPFGFRELVARIGAVLRRTTTVQSTDEGPVELGALRVDRRTHQVTMNDTAVSLSPKEYDLVVYLASDPGAVFAREDIIRDVWDENWWGSTKTLDVHIASLRKKLGSDAIHTVRGVGFSLVDSSASP
jgi:DNA-binding response OmpR family regulator